jgi:hypothetical protein
VIRPPHPHEIALLPQIENAADRRYRDVGLQCVLDMPAHSIASLTEGWRKRQLWIAASRSAAARALGHDRLNLSTYRDVPWNGPFYLRRGLSHSPLPRLGGEAG